MKTRVIVVSVVKKGDFILLGRKPQGTGPYPDTWHIPGGGVKLGNETCEEAIKREIREEANIDICNLRKVYWDSDITNDKHGEETYYLFLAYTSEYLSGDLNAGTDLSIAEWVRIDSLDKYNLNKPAHILLKQLGLL